MRWTAVSTGEMTIADSRIRRERFLADVTKRYNMLPICLDNVSMGTLTEKIFYAMHQIIELLRELCYTSSSRQK